jgi:TrmH family RNA methyltransferase
VIFHASTALLIHWAYAAYKGELLAVTRITSRKNPLILHMKKLGDSRKYRAECGEFLCDGDKLLDEALQCGCEIVCVLTSDETLPPVVNADMYLADDGLMAYVSPMKTPQAVLFSCKIPGGASVNPHGRNILLDGLQDAGNVGNVFRSALAFECDCVILTGDCADPYNPKAVRASMGAVFKQPFAMLELSDILSFKERGMRIYGAALGDSSVDIRQVQLKNACVAIGTEGRGLSRNILDLCDGRVIIPMSDKMQSLNAATAAAIILWRIYSE